MQRVPSLLLVEDDPGQARLAQRALARAGYAAEWVASGAACRAALRARSFEIVLLDRGLPDADGLDLLSELRANCPDLCVIMLTGADEVTVAVRAMRGGAADYVLKRPDLSHLDDLPLIVERNWEWLRLRREREALHAAVAASEERYRELFENASDLIVVCDASTRIRRTNRVFQELTGTPGEAAEGQPFAAFFAPSSPVTAEALLAKAVASTGEAAMAEIHLRGPDERPRVIEFRARPIFQDGAPCGFHGIGRDITEKRRMEEMKADFLAMVTHDMKNPVSVIVGYTEILLSDVCPNGICREMLVSIGSCARGLLHLVLNFLDLSRIEAGVLRLDRAPVRLEEVLRQVLDYERPLARAKKIELAAKFHALPVLQADRLQLDRGFVNLIGNAIKFTPPGGRVSVTAEVSDGSVVVRVSDTGPGIPAQQIPHLFRKYQRLSRTAQADGTGLGLFIAKSMIDAHGGTIAVESSPGLGATFIVRLPLS